MSDPSFVLQAAAVARLKASAPLAGLIGDRVYDEVPAKAKTPFVNVGDGQVLGNDDDCSDESEITFQVHAFTNDAADPGWPKVKQIAGAVRDAMKPEWMLAGFDVLLSQYVQTQFMRDPDGKTRHAMIEFRFVISH